MVKKMSKYGNSLAILIDKPILELLNINEHTQLKIKTDGKSIIIEPIKEITKKVSAKTKKAYKDIEEKHKEAFKKLADN